jgi:aminopeptidase-like protein
MRIYRCRSEAFGDDDRIDANMRKIISLMDGRKSLVSIAFASGMTMSDFQKAVRSLIERGLIVSVEREGALQNG